MGWYIWDGPYGIVHMGWYIWDGTYGMVHMGWYICDGTYHHHHHHPQKPALGGKAAQPVDRMLCLTVHEPESPGPPPVDVLRCSVDDPWYVSFRYRAYVATHVDGSM